MTEEPKDKTTESTESKTETGPASPENQPANPAPGPAAPAQGAQPPRNAGAPARPGDQSRPQNRPPYQGPRPGANQPGSGAPRPPYQGPRPGSGAPRPPYQGPRPPQQQQQPPQQPQNPGDPQQQPAANPAAPKPPIDWLRSKPMSSANRPPQQQRGLDLGRPDAWSGRQKPPAPGQAPTPGAPRPAGPGEQRPAGPGGPSRPPDGSQPYRPRPAGPGGTTTYQGRPSTGGYQGAPRPGGFGTPRPGGFGTPRPGGFGPPRPGGFGPARPGGSRPPFGQRPGAPTTEWGKGTATSRRARSARKGGKEKEKPAIEEDADERTRRRAEQELLRPKGVLVAQRPGVKSPLVKGKGDPNAPDISRATIVPARITVKDLAELLNISSVEIIKELMKSGIMAPINQMIDFDTASIVAADLGFEIRLAEAQETEEEEALAVAPEAMARAAKIVDIEDDPGALMPRPPVVTIMGHVDHGKTSLLDAIRRTNVAGGEFGGITQHIGAYQVEEKNQKITFLDTPGHEAFTAMRARGAQVTDIAIVVVAADDGVQPQTLEAINHARAAGVPIVVALNKIDKDNANPERVKQQLSDAGLMPEEWGGSTVVVPVSAKKGVGVNDLLDMILLVAEMASLKANPHRPALGTIVEAEMDKAKGPLATVLVQKGTLNVGDYVVVGSIYGKIRAMFNDKGKSIKTAPPSTPAGILGLSDVPASGDVLRVMADDRTAHDVAREEIDKQQRLAASSSVPTIDLERLSGMIAAGAVKELNIVLKADVQGSLEPIVNSLNKLGDEKENVKVHLLHQATGMITENDVSLAAASRSGSAAKAALVIGFNVEADSAAKRVAEQQGIEIRTFKIIYDLVDAIDKSLRGLYEPKYQEAVDAHADVRQVFKLTKGSTIAGSIISDGTMVRGAQCRVRRNNAVVFEGKVSSLRRFKDDVRDVGPGYECGITLDGFNDFQEKDVIETYHKERIN